MVNKHWTEQKQISHEQALQVSKELQEFVHTEEARPFFKFFKDRGLDVYSLVCNFYNESSGRFNQHRVEYFPLGAMIHPSPDELSIAAARGLIVEKDSIGKVKLRAANDKDEAMS